MGKKIQKRRPRKSVNSSVLKYNAIALNKLSRLSPCVRKKHISKWPTKSFQDIKKVCKGICHNKKIPRKALLKLNRQKKVIRKITGSSPNQIKSILINQKGGFLGTLAGVLIPPVISAIANLVTNK